MRKRRLYGRKLRIKAIRSLRSLELRAKLGIVAWGVCRKTFRASAVVEGLLAMVAKAGAPAGASMAPWYCAQFRAASRSPESRSPNSWLRAVEPVTARSKALHAMERAADISSPLQLAFIYS